MPQEAKQKHVLIVDDDPLMAALEAELLDEAGYSVDVALGGQAGIDRLDRRRPDLVILDIVMPTVDGWGVLRHIHTLPSPPPVIVATGLAEVVPPDPLGGLVAGHLFKPFRGDALLKMCADVLAAPVVTPPSGARKEPRRTYVADATLLSPGGAPLVVGQLLQISRGGFRLAMVGRVQPGHTVSISFRIPGREHPIELRGTVRWRNAVMMGVETKRLTPRDEDLLRRFVEGDDQGTDAGSESRAPVSAAA